ncbi:MFS family permease [Rhizobium fabae]|uniref:MFS family permease n=1 Tax=Rhizobium fabae TaxID=573179 RepID=A0A7W6B5K4_9HYPH|nr:MFS family permease [Rhizobium fabae]
MKPIVAEGGEANAERTPSVRWALASLSLSMLLPSLGTSIANVALPSLAKAFDAAFQDVQWIVLAYLLTITILIVSVGRLGDTTGRRRLCSSASCSSRWLPSCAASRRPYRR